MNGCVTGCNTFDVAIYDRDCFDNAIREFLESVPASFSDRHKAMQPEVVKAVEELERVWHRIKNQMRAP